MVMEEHVTFSQDAGPGPDQPITMYENCHMRRKHGHGAHTGLGVVIATEQWLRAGKITVGGGYPWKKTFSFT